MKHLKQITILGGLCLTGLSQVASADGPTSTTTKRIEKIPFNTHTTEDPNLTEGTTVIDREGVEGEREYTTTITSAVEGNPGVANNTLNFTTKAPMNTTTTTDTKPTVLDILLDYSSSYRGKINTSIDQAKMLINEAITNPNSKVIIQAYTMNTATSYGVNGGDIGMSTKLLTKQQAIEILDELKTLKSPTDPGGPTTYPMYFQSISDKFGKYQYNADSAQVSFEQIVTEVTSPDDTVSVVQFTDGWVNHETIDETFASWAKKRAKTFMSVVNRKNVVSDETNDENSINAMNRVGHPNIYDMTPDDLATASQKLLEKFRETAVEKVTATKGEDQTAHITIGGDGVTVTEVRLGNESLPIVDGRVDVTKKLPDGSYTVTYTGQGNGTVQGRVLVDNKQADTKSDTVRRAEGRPASSTTTNRVIKDPINKLVRIGTAGTVTESRKEPIPFATEIIEDESMDKGTERVTVEGVTGEREYLTTYKTVKGQKVGQPIETTSHLTKHVVTKIIHRGVRGSKTEVENVDVPFTTRTVEDDTLPLGTRKIVQVGQNGTRTITRTWTTQRDLKVGDPTTSKVVSKEPREEIIHIGTREFVRNERYESLGFTHANTKSSEGQKGQKLVIDWYSLAKGKRVSEITTTEHLLRMPINEVNSRAKVGTGNGFSIRRLTLPPKTQVRPTEIVTPYESDITSQALSVLRKYKF